MKVYITGVGGVSPMGKTVDEMYGNYIEGLCPIREVEMFKELDGLKSHIGSFVENLDISDIDRKVRRTCSKMSLMTIVAAKEALNQANLNESILNESRSMIAIGSTTGSAQEFHDVHQKFHENKSVKGQKSVSVFKCMSHTGAGNLALALNFKGALLSPASACAAGNQSIVLAHQLIKAGLYDIVITGGCEEAHATTCMSFDIAYASSTNFNNDPQGGSRPFDKNRDGLVVSEGAGVVIVESEESMKRRGSTPLAEVVGGAYRCSGAHMAQMDRETMTHTMEDALVAANIDRDKIDYVNCHATSTVHGDIEETHATRNVFDRKIPVSSLKGYTGHTFAACASLETAMMIKMMQDQQILPNIKMTEQDPEVADLDYVNELRNTKLDYTLNNSFAFGGISSSFILKKI